MKIFLARHGEYQNPDSVVPYRLPGFPLSDLGRQQARGIADQLVDQKIRAIYTSPIERCLEEATIVGKTLKLFPNPRPELTETGTPLQGLTKDELAKHSPNYPYDIPEHIAQGGESPQGIFERMSTFIDSLKSTSSKSSYLLVSHGDPIFIYLSGLLLKKVPYNDQDFYESKIRYVPMGGLVMLDYGKSGVPKYQEII